MQEEKKNVLLCTESLEAKFLSGATLRGRFIDIRKYRFIKEKQSVSMPYIQVGIATLP